MWLWSKTQVVWKMEHFTKHEAGQLSVGTDVWLKTQSGIRSGCVCMMKRGFEGVSFWHDVVDVSPLGILSKLWITAEEMWCNDVIAPWVCFSYDVFCKSSSSRAFQQRWIQPSRSSPPCCTFRRAWWLEIIESERSVLQEWQWERLPFFTAEDRVRGTILRCFLHSAAQSGVRVKGGLFQNTQT